VVTDSFKIDKMREVVKPVIEQAHNSLN
jgi:hypothetical protein